MSNREKVQEYLNEVATRYRAWMVIEGYDDPEGYEPGTESWEEFRNSQPDKSWLHHIVFSSQPVGGKYDEPCEDKLKRIIGQGLVCAEVPPVVDGCLETLALWSDFKFLSAREKRIRYSTEVYNPNAAPEHQRIPGHDFGENELDELYDHFCGVPSDTAYWWQDKPHQSAASHQGT